jgi:hypothetical protein
VVRRIRGRAQRSGARARNRVAAVIQRSLAPITITSTCTSTNWVAGTVDVQGRPTVPSRLRSSRIEGENPAHVRRTRPPEASGVREPLECGSPRPAGRAADAGAPANARVVARGSARLRRGRGPCRPLVPLKSLAATTSEITPVARAARAPPRRGPPSGRSSAFRQQAFRRRLTGRLCAPYIGPSEVFRAHPGWWERLNIRSYDNYPVNAAYPPTRIQRKTGETRSRPLSQSLLAYHPRNRKWGQIWRKFAAVERR